MSNYEATKYDFSGASLTGIEGVNTGLIVPWGNDSTPSGFLDCDGTAVSRATYANLFAVIGTTYGIGDGSTTFNLPDLIDKVVLGKSANKALASTGGANTVTNTGNLSGTVGNTTIDSNTLASHLHSMRLGSSGGGTPMAFDDFGAFGGGSTSSGSTGGGGAHSHNLSASFTGSADSVLQPYASIKYIIKT
jgi:microcystin-dependent protein